MKITFLMPCYMWGPSGGFKVVYEYANRLVARGHQVAIVHPRRLKFPPPERLSLRQRLHKARVWLRELQRQPQIRWHSIDPRVRMTYAPSSDACYIPDGDVLFATAWHTVRSVLACSREKGEKCYLIQHHEIWQGPKALVEETWRAPLHKVGVSKWLLDVGKTLGIHNISHIPPAVDPNIYRLIRPIQNRGRQVAMMFSHVAFKSSADGIQALQIAKREYPDLRVVLFGINRATSMVPDWMTYLLDPPQQEIVGALNDSSVVLSPSIAEGFGLPLAEGAACGCAMVSTDSGGVRDFIIDGETGLLSPPKNPEALARNLCRVLAGDDLRIRLAQAGHDFIKSFTWERSTDLLETFMARVLQKRAADAVLPNDFSSHATMQQPAMETN